MWRTHVSDGREVKAAPGAGLRSHVADVADVADSAASKAAKGAWAGPYQGTKLIDGAAWYPYQPTTFPTPPFPEYSSGHGNFSAAAAEILRLFTHSDRFRGSTTLPAGSSKIEPEAVPASDVTLSWPTFSDAANQAGISRRYGGIHFEQGDLDARATGRIVARMVWEKAREYWGAS